MPAVPGRPVAPEMLPGVPLEPVVPGAPSATLLEKVQLLRMSRPELKMALLFVPPPLAIVRPCRVS